MDGSGSGGHGGTGRMRNVGRACGNGILVEDTKVKRIRPPIAVGHGPPDFALAGGFFAVVGAFALWVSHGCTFYFMSSFDSI